MSKLLGFLGLRVGGSVGWAVGERFSFTLAFLLGIVGTGLGLYVGRRVAEEYF